VGFFIGNWFVFLKSAIALFNAASGNHDVVPFDVNYRSVFLI